MFEHLTQKQIYILNFIMNVMFFIFVVGLATVATYLFIRYVVLKRLFKSDDIMMSGSVVVVTGAEDGIGFVVAKDLAKRGAKVYMGCHDMNKGIAALKSITLDTGMKQVYVRELNMASFKSVLKFAKLITDHESHLEVLVNAATTPWKGELDNRLSKDGLPYEVHYNYFGPFLLTLLLAPLMTFSHIKTTRIINMTSFMYRYGKLNLDDFDKLPTGDISYTEVYANIKLAVILITMKWSEMLKRARVNVNCFDAGYVDNDFINHSIWDRVRAKLFAQTYKEAAQTPIAMAVMPQLKYVTGRYFYKMRLSKLSSLCYNPVLADELWDLSLRTVKRDFCMHFPE